MRFLDLAVADGKQIGSSPIYAYILAKRKPKHSTVKCERRMDYGNSLSQSQRKSQRNDESWSPAKAQDNWGSSTYLSFAAQMPCFIGLYFLLLFFPVHQPLPHCYTFVYQKQIKIKQLDSIVYLIFVSSALAHGIS